MSSLVANYDSSSDEEEESNAVEDIKAPSKDVKAPSRSVEDVDAISDEDEENLHFVDDEDEEIAIGVASKASSLFSSLPSSSSIAAKSSFVDENEDASDIPKAKEVEIAMAQKAKTALRKKPKGPVKIVLPSLATFKDIDEDDSESKPRPTVNASEQRTSSLLSLLPPPKSGATSLGLMNGSTASVKGRLVPDSVARKPVSRPSLVPDSVARKRNASMMPTAVRKKSKKADSDSSDDEEVSKSSFFSLGGDEDDVGKLSEMSTSSLSKPITANPQALAPTDRPLAFRGRESAVENSPEPTTSTSFVGPSKPSTSSAASYEAYPEASDLMANSDALERLAGKNQLRKQKTASDSEFANVMEVNADSLTGDPREWLVKALTEEDPDKPGPRNTIKGEQKRRHQITYLAAYAKENENKFKAQWATSAANKRAAGQKYGFF